MAKKLKAPILKDSSKELKDHYVNLEEDDMLNPNLSICAGIRWLFRKKELHEAKMKRPTAWLEIIEVYKGANNKSEAARERIMRKFTEYYNEMNKN